MCGIAGLLDQQGHRSIDPGLLQSMGRAILSRGPDQDGRWHAPGVGLASQRLAIVGLNNGRQPLFSEDGKVIAVCNGEFFNYPEVRARLESSGHRFNTESDCEILVHLWEDLQEQMFSQLRGQFAFALYDSGRRRLILGRDRLGICPLFYAQQQGWLVFGSEIKALLASGLVEARFDPLALDHVYSFFAMAGRRTMFEGVRALLPGHFLRVSADGVEERQYWDLDFPDQGQELRGPGLVEDFGRLLHRSVELRLRADVPVVSYLSGGVDSSLVACLASQRLGRPIPTFTIRIPHPRLDEVPRAMLTASVIGSCPQVVHCGDAEIAESYPELVMASECPVLDTSSAAIYRLARAVRQAGFKVALSGEGADEALAGYPWFKVHRLLSWLELPGWGPWLRRRFFARAPQRPLPFDSFPERYDRMGGVHASSDLYAASSLAGYRVYSDEMLEQMGRHTACHDLVLNRQAMSRWHPLNRGLYLGYKVMLSGLLMTHKGDRPAMANSVEARFPFLDEDVVEFCTRLAPEYKLRHLRRDKDLLRSFAAHYLPAAVAQRPKHIFRARYAGSFLHRPPAYVGQLLSEESLRKTGYFDPRRVDRARRFLTGWHLRLGTHMRDEMALVGVVSTQLWHHLFLGGGLCELPVWGP